MQRNLQPRTMPIVLLAATLAMPTSSAWAAPNPCHPALAAPQTCTLMTEEECTAHLHRLETLANGPDRTRYLNEHLALIKERESACSCSLLQSAKTVIYPRVQQSMLKL